MKPPKGYEYISTIAENTTTIWLARDIETQIVVMVKTLDLKQVEDWKGIELFEREVATLKQLNHPAIPKFIDLIKDNGKDSQRWHIVQENVKGVTISKMLENKTLMNETELVSIATQILDILIYLNIDLNRVSWARRCGDFCNRICHRQWFFNFFCSKTCVHLHSSIGGYG